MTRAFVFSVISESNMLIGGIALLAVNTMQESDFDRADRKMTGATHLFVSFARSFK